MSEARQSASLPFPEGVVRGWLAQIDQVREGQVESCVLFKAGGDTIDDKGTVVTRRNALDTRARICVAFAPLVPALLEEVGGVNTPIAYGSDLELYRATGPIQRSAEDLRPIPEL